MKRSLHSNIRFSKSIYFILAFILLANFAIGQKSKLVEGGVINGIPYASTQFENINMTNGNVNLDFPLPSLQGRGEVSHTYQLRYSSKLWKTITNPVYNPFYVPDPTYQNFLAEADDAGWQDFDGYQLQIWNRMSGMDVPQGNHCDSGFVWMTAYRWKVEVAAPDGRKIQFRPIGYSDVPPGQSDNVGYFNVHPSGAVSSVVGPGGACYVVETTPSGARMTYYSSDGSGIRLTFANQEQLGFVWEMSMPDGSRIIQKVGGGQKIIDRNGNYIEGTTITLPDSSQAPGWMDQFGRWIARKKNFQTNEDRYYQLGFNGVLLTWKVLWKNVYVRKNYTTTCNTCPSNQRGPVIDAQAETEFRVVDKIVLPEQLGELEYVFDYHAKNVDNSELSPGWGEIKSITIPTGAKISYGYKLSGLVASEEEDEPLAFDLFLRADQIIERAGTINKKVLSYTETYDGQSEEKSETWIYGIGRSSSTMTSPNGGVTNQYYWDIRDDEVKGGQVYKETKPDGTIIERNWGNNVPVGATYGSLNHLNAFVNFEVVTIPDANGNPALSRITDYHHDLNGNLIYTAEYDWIPANSAAIQRTGGYVTGFSGITPVRSSHSTYANPTPEFGSTSSSNNEYYFSSAPAFRNLVATTEVRDGAGDPKARTEITYDYTSFTTNTIGGNITQSKAWDSFKGGQSRAYSNPLTTTNSIVTSAIYNDDGMPTETIDANNITTQITYGEIAGPTQNYTDLYPTQTIVAYGTPVARTSAATYDFYTGLVLTATDVDNNLTNATEYDALGRPTKAISALGVTGLESWTQTTYHDGSVSDPRRYIIVRSDLETKEDGRKVATQFFDQLGRVRLVKTLEDALSQDPYNETDGIKVQTRYQSGNPNSFQLTSNPFRAANATLATNESTMGWTRSTTWNHGRRQEVETFSGTDMPAPWGSNNGTTGVVITESDAERTLVTDQAGKKRISRSNAIGQLKDVWEITDQDGATEAVTFSAYSGLHGYRTSYNYDPLNNLTVVNQGVQSRTFSYSSLSRLLSATNPESGAISYQYDPNGNLTRKTDARGVQTDYIYDALSRVTNRNYSTPGGTPSNYQTTPNVVYTYDDPAVPNSKGKLTKVVSSVSTTEYVAFDILGRVTRSKQTTDGVVYGEDSNPMTYTYNLSGALIEQQYPSGRVVKNTIDSDGSLALVQSKKNASDYNRPYASNFAYNAGGALTAMKLGNGRWETTAYNSRLQPTQIGLGSGVNSQNLLDLDYTYGTTQNNGNVLSQTITVPTVGQTPGFVATQSYSYDPLNRLKQAAENITPNGGSQTLSWQQTFTFDRYGNRNFDEANTTFAGFDKLCGESTELCSDLKKRLNPTSNMSNNRLSTSDDYAFDASGSTTSDPDDRTFIYDAENKQVEVKDSLNNTIGQYSYDGDGRRVKKYVPATGEVTVFIYDAGSKLIGEYSSIVQTGSIAKIIYTTNDHLGSPRINTDGIGVVVSRHDYHPFGEEIARTGYGSDTIRKKFTGYERDNESELDFAKARYHNYNHGRFTSPDPLFYTASRPGDPQRFNLYAYVRNNPLRLVDPDGKDAKGASVKDDKIVELTEEDRKKLQKQLSRIAPGTKVRADGSIKKPNFFQRVANRIAGKSGGTDLVGRLVDSKQTTTIAVNNLQLTQTVAGTVAAANNGELVDGNRFEQMAKNGTPTDTIVFWDPNQKAPEGAILNNVASETSPDPASNLAHELIHAEHAVRGSAPKSGLYSQQFTYQGQTYSETERSDEEFRTVGLYGFARPGDITENQIRRELGLRPRISYGGLP